MRSSRVYHIVNSTFRYLSLRPHLPLILNPSFGISIKMPSSTSTITSSKTKTADQTARLRLNPKHELRKSGEAAQVPIEGQDEHFFWTYTEEPHRTRRQAIIKAHPEVCDQSNCAKNTAHIGSQVLKLCGAEPLTKYIVGATVLLQITCAYLLRNTPILSVPFILTAYVIGATANHSLFLAIHEISHNLAFRSGLANRLFAIFANIPIGIPYSATFRVSF